MSSSETHSSRADSESILIEDSGGPEEHEEDSTSGSESEELSTGSESTHEANFMEPVNLTQSEGLVAPAENKATDKSRSISPILNDSDIDASSSDKKLLQTDKTSSGPMNAHYNLKVKISHYEHEIGELRNTNRELRERLNHLEPLEKQLNAQRKLLQKRERRIDMKMSAWEKVKENNGDVSSVMERINEKLDQLAERQEILEDDIEELTKRELELSNIEKITAEKINEELNSLELKKDEVEEEYSRLIEEREKCQESYETYSKSKEEIEEEMKSEIEQLKTFKSEQTENFAMEYENLVAGMKALDKIIGDLESLKEFQDNGKNTEKYGYVLTNLATLYGNTDEFEKQRHWSQRALEVFRNMHCEDHACVASALIVLSKAYDNLRNYEQERDLLKEAITIMEKCCEEHEICDALVNLSEAYYKLGDHETQCETLERVLNMKQNEMSLVLEKMIDGYGRLGNFGRQKELQDMHLSSSFDYSCELTYE